MILSGKRQIAVDTAALTNGDTIGSYLVDAAGNLLTSTLANGNQNLDVFEIASHLDSSAYATGVDYLSSMGVVNNAGNWVPLTLNAAGELPVAATVNFAGDYAEDSAHVSGDIGLFNLSVRRDARTSGTSADGDYASFNTNAVGELWVKDADVLARLVLINTDTSAILADTATIDTNIASILAEIQALSHAEDVAHASGDMGIQFLGVRQDTTASNAANGDYTSIQTWSNGELKTVNNYNASILQQVVSVTTTATALPTTALANRKTIMIQNDGAGPIFVGSATVTSTGATRGIRVNANGELSLDLGPAVTLYAIANAGTRDTIVLEAA